MDVWKWVVGTWVGVLPGTAAYCNLAAMGKTMRKNTTMTPLQKAVMGSGVVAALAVVYILSEIAKKALAEKGIGDDGATGTVEQKMDAHTTGQDDDSRNNHDDDAADADDDDQVDDDSDDGSSTKVPIDVASLYVGGMVRVAARSWANINKPGGIGRVTKIQSGNTADGTSTVDVKYVLGGSEKNIDLKYVGHVEFEDLELPFRTPRKGAQRRVSMG